MAIKSLYPEFQSLYDTRITDAFTKWQQDPANASYVSGTPGGGRQIFDELVLHDPNAGIGSVNKSVLEQEFLLGKGLIPIGPGMSYAASQLGMTVPQLLQSKFPGGQFLADDPGGSGFGAGAGFWQTPGPVDPAVHGTLEMAPKGSAFGAFKDAWSSGLGLIVGGALGAGLLSGLGGAAGASSFGAGIGTEMGLGGIGLDAAASAAAGYGGGIGGGMSFFDDLIGDFGFDVGENLVNNPDVFGAGFSPAPQFDWLTGEWAVPTTPDMSFAPGGSLMNPGGNNWLTGLSASSGWGTGLDFGLNSDLLSKVKNLLPGDTSALSRTLLGDKGLSGLFGDSGLLGTAASIAPSLAAINYARNLGDPDISRLESAYSTVDPNALALPYDIQTGKGRNALTSSLADRGVMGSSFGYQDLNSYDTLRDLGRSNLLTQGAGTRANIASQILAAQEMAKKNKLDLYGRALLALSGGLNPARAGAF